jgi:hypothetical protein
VKHLGHWSSEFSRYARVCWEKAKGGSFPAATCPPIGAFRKEFMAIYMSDDNPGMFGKQVKKSTKASKSKPARVTAPKNSKGMPKPKK